MPPDSRPPGTPRRIRESPVSARAGPHVPGGSVAREHAVQLAAVGDPELGEDLVQVVLDRARADEELGANLGVRHPRAAAGGRAGCRRRRRSGPCEGPCRRRRARARRRSPIPSCPRGSAPARCPTPGHRAGRARIRESLVRRADPGMPRARPRGGYTGGSLSMRAASRADDPLVPWRPAAARSRTEPRETTMDEAG